MEVEMNKYGQAAIDAVNLIKKSISINPAKAWEQSTSNIFGKGTSSQIKGCPKATFLGLCEEGLIRGIPPGKYTRSRKNKEYAVTAVKLIKRNPDYTLNKRLLWYKITNDKNKKYNEQMDVVIVLWEKELIL